MLIRLLHEHRFVHFLNEKNTPPVPVQYLISKLQKGFVKPIQQIKQTMESNYKYNTTIGENS